MQPHTVGLLGATGLVGSATYKLLVKSAIAGDIKLIVLHRPGRAPSDPRSDSVQRRAVVLDGPEDDLIEAVKSINTFICTLGVEGLPLEDKVARALCKSPDIVTYVPAAFSVPWGIKDESDEAFGPLLTLMRTGWNEAKKLGLPVTTVFVGAFTLYFYTYEFLGTSIKANYIHANDRQMKNAFPFTTVEDLARALQTLAIRPPSSVKNKSYAAVSFYQTGNDIKSMLQKMNNSEPAVTSYTDSDIQSLQKDTGNFGPLKVGYLTHWENSDWPYPEEHLLEPRKDVDEIEQMIRGCF